MQGKEDYYKPVSVGKFWCKNYIEYESNGDGNKTLSMEEYLFFFFSINTIVQHSKLKSHSRQAPKF